MALTALRTAALGVTGAALIAGVVGCSSGGTSTESTTSATASSSTATSESTSAAAAPDDHDAFTACMTEHGVPAPPEGGPPAGMTPPSGPPPSGAPQPGEGKTPPAPQGIDQGTWDKANEACASLAPAPPK